MQMKIFILRLSSQQNLRNFLKVYTNSGVCVCGIQHTSSDKLLFSLVSLGSRLPKVTLLATISCQIMQSIHQSHQLKVTLSTRNSWLGLQNLQSSPSSKVAPAAIKIQASWVVPKTYLPQTKPYLNLITNHFCLGHFHFLKF